MLSVRCVLVYIFSVYNFVRGDHFGYSAGEQELWDIKNPQCHGYHQSPIDINIQRSIPVKIRPMILSGFNDVLSYPMRMVNNGHTVNITPEDPDALTPIVSGGPLKGVYEFKAFHFHWGKRDYKGSEHSINGQRYSLELHMVFRNVNYNNAKQALRNKDGLLVMAILFEVSSFDNPYLYPITRNLYQVRNANETIPIATPFTVKQLMAGINAGKYYTYRGSLTTPPCSEAVTWIVFADILKVSSEQLTEFRQLKSSDGEFITKNHRFVQPLNGRRVYVRVRPTQALLFKKK